MGIRGELYTEQIKVENRTYFFNVKENSKGDVFLQVVESKPSEGQGFNRHSVVIFEDELQNFLQGLDRCIDFIEKNKTKKFKEIMKKREANKNKIEESWKKVKVSTHKESKSNNKKRIIIKKH